MDLNLSSAFANKLVFFQKLSSTNDFLLREAQENPSDWPDFSVACAGTQTAGKGRNQREWQSPEGASISCSVLVRAANAPAHWYGILIAMALTRSLREQGVDAGLKWPNDVLVNERKIAGVLGQAGTDMIVVGIGINLLPVEIENSVSIQQLGLTVDFDSQLAQVLREFVELRQQFEIESTSAIVGELRDISHTLGREVQVVTDSGKTRGFATDIDEQGRLVLDQGKLIVSAGDILHLRGVEKS